ncbi:hypothetical protein COS83_00080 [archaeon CG07_land_8_20_14_0_80_38_8]|nr:MAG: hypothetical protein COS83_00080 [archaeon CG07_land_8_20_14_0_80_38_8]PIU89225.1 MAG: hypothetical protein COS64_01415 [archaeon CG06_land_8_20_14_3_00_37_11]
MNAEEENIKLLEKYRKKSLSQIIDDFKNQGNNWDSIDLLINGSPESFYKIINEKGLNNNERSLLANYCLNRCITKVEEWNVKNPSWKLDADKYRSIISEYVKISLMFNPEILSNTSKKY